MLNEVDMKTFSELELTQVNEIADRQFKLLKGVRFNVGEYITRFKPTDIELACYNKKYSWSNRRINYIDQE